MILYSIVLIIGFVMLIKGADIFVDGSSSMAGNFKVPKILIGLTIVAFGTSAPEFAVSVKSIISGSHDIVLGNVIGSNILNILLILGISSIIRPLMVSTNTVRKELPMMILMMTIFGTLLSDSVFNEGMVNSFPRSDGIVVLLFFSVFVYYLVKMAIRSTNNELLEKKELMPLSKSVIYTILGIIMISLGSHLVVDNASNIAKAIGISEKIIALTIIAFGTSLPELVTSVVAAKKGECDLAIGNIVGSNIFNVGIVIGIPVAIFGGINTFNFNSVDLIVMLVSSLLLFIFLLDDRKLSRKEGIMFLLILTAYYIYVLTA